MINDKLLTRLVLSADEAREQGLVKLAQDLEVAVDDNEVAGEAAKEADALKNSIHRQLWKMFLEVAEYHHIDTLDPIVANHNIDLLVEEIIDQYEKVLDIK